MRPTDELTMYAYGLLEPGEEAVLRAHVDACAACAERVGRLREEKHLLERAAGREPVHPDALRSAVDRAIAPPGPVHRRSLIPYALAGALLLGLAGALLYRPSPVDTTADAKRNVTADPIDRLIGELKSPNPLRREVGVFALASYGKAVAGKLRKAEVDPALFPGVRFQAQDQALLELLRTKKLDCDFENARADAILKAVGDMLGLRIVVDAKGDPRWDPAKTVTFKTKDLAALNVLKLFGSQFGLNVFAEDGKVILSPNRAPGEPRAPIRIGNRGATAAALVRALESPSEDERVNAERELERLNFAAEGELWAGLDSPIARARETAARLLQRLYDERQACTPPSSSAAVKETLREKKVSLDMDNAPLTAAVDYLAQIAKRSIHITGIDNPDQRMISLKGDDLTLFEALTLALEPNGLGFAVRGDVVLITNREGGPDPRRGGPLWATSEEAARIEALLEALGARDMNARRKAEEGLAAMGEGALAPLGEAARLLDLPLSAQARALRTRILEEQKLWLLDAGSGAELQEWSDEQKRILKGRMTFSFESLPRSEVLKTLAQTQGRRIEIRERPAGTVTLAVKDLPFESLLKALTRPHGLDFYLDGDLIVIDDASKVRAAVEQ